MSNVFKILTLIIFLVSIRLVSEAQTGVVSVDFREFGDNYIDDHITIQVLQNDVVVSEYKEFIRDVENFTDTLDVGTYKVSYFINFNKDVIGEIKKIEIKSGQETSIIFYSPIITTDSIDTNSFFNNNGYAILSLSTGNNFINPDNDIFSAYNQFGFQIGGTSNIINYLEIGQQFGSSMSYTYFNESKSLYPNFDKSTEKYYYWNLNYMVFLRATFYNNSKRSRGLFMDGGISYNFPLLFRHVLVKGDTKTATKKIHHYNDFSAVFRLGFTPVAFTFEYRLTNFLDTFYPEQPKMKAGISFIFGE